MSSSDTMKKKTNVDPQVIEAHGATGCKWFVSFYADYNPEDDQCVQCASEEDAFRLQRFIKSIRDARK